ncbi:ATP-dependent DNA helicase [Anaeromyxobacter diazotrophicus]|uniref:ATP-dependent DNA helicase n=1 Tax=Anaeromyxobacter diazotrophicus TaxID=2590199 RepID=UPI001591CF92|nr:helicase C-terminal domain-containing protein [Anaeromyxobacter diazotrophicus]
MARAVERALGERRYLVAEAGTGTGKTLAYLVPAALSGRKVIISTATKTLQEQIWQRDLPLLAERAGLEVEAAYLKGRANYYCLERGAKFAERPTFESRGEAALWPRIQEWARATLTGDRSEIDLPDQYGAWRELSASGETCLGKECQRHDECFVTLARARAAQADVVLVNHHLFFADLVLRTSRAGVEVLPPYDAVIFDEAHALSEVATDYFGLSVSSYRVDDLARDAVRAVADRPDLMRLVKDRTGELEKAGERFFAGVAARMGSSPSSKMRGRAPSYSPLAPGQPPPAAPALAPWRGARGAGPAARGDLKVALSDDLLGPLEPDQARLDGALEDVREVFADAEATALAAIGRRAAELRVELRAVTTLAEPSRVHFAEARGRGVFLRAVPVDVAEELVERLYRRVDTAVFTSATLAAGGRLDYFRREVGLAPEFDVDEAIFPGPFDYARQAALVVPDGLPEPASPAFTAAAAAAVRELVAVTGGRAFVLSTSMRGMNALREALADLPYQLLLQGERPKAKLLDAFREEPSVLFATQSFWEGVDVPGEALSLVVIDKLPFAPPTDPVLAARGQALAAEGRDAFSELSVPAAALALKQGFGRLIRTRRDRGLVAVLDRRLTTKGYGRAFLATLPPAPLLRSVEAARRWWAGA